MTNLPPDDQAPEWREFHDDATAAEHVPQFDLTDPASVAFVFFSLITDPSAEDVELLRSLTTPESHPAWGDFAQFIADFSTIPDSGIGNMPTPAIGDSKVVYAKVFSQVEQSYQALEEQVVMTPGVFTLVWRPEFGRWLIHGFGEPIPPELVPHGDGA